MHSLSSLKWNGLSFLEKSLCLSITGTSVLLSVFFFLRCSAEAAVFYTLFTFGYSLFLVASIWFYGHWLAQLNPSKSPGRQVVRALVISTLLSILLEITTLIGAPVSSPFAFSDWGKKRLLIYLLLSFVMVTVTIYHYEKNKLLGYSNITEALTRYLKGSFQAKAIITFSVIAIVGGHLLGITTWRTPEQYSRLAFLCICTLSGLVLYLGHQNIFKQHFEYWFLIIALSTGSFISVALPAISRISWDDQIHYDRSLGLSYLTESQYGEAEILLVNYPEDLFRNPGESVDLLSELHENETTDGSVNKRTGFYTPVSGASLLNISTIGYIPSAIGLWLGRLLALPFSVQFILGRFTNMLAYVLVMTQAIRIIPYKKMVLTVLGLLPTTIFLSSNYSYDSFCIAFISLAIALILREAQRQEAISLSDLVKICLALFLGLCPKAIYFPIIALMYLIPKNRFGSSATYRNFCLAVFCFGCIMFATFMLPMFLSTSAQAGDSRGGEDVSAIGQILFIFTNPILFITTISNFLLTYISPLASNDYSIYYAYLGKLSDSFYFTNSIGFVLLMYATLTDSGNTQLTNAPLKKAVFCSWMVFLFLFSTFLVATSLYISFTPVGLNTVNGCQGRYLLPVLFLLFASISQSATNNRHRSCRPTLMISTALLIMCNVTMIVFPNTSL